MGSRPTPSHTPSPPPGAARTAVGSRSSAPSPRTTTRSSAASSVCWALNIFSVPYTVQLATSFSCHDTHKSVLRSPPESARPGPHNSRHHTRGDSLATRGGRLPLRSATLGPGTALASPTRLRTGAPRPLHTWDGAAVGPRRCAGLRSPVLARGSIRTSCSFACTHSLYCSTRKVVSPVQCARYLKVARLPTVRGALSSY